MGLFRLMPPLVSGLMPSFTFSLISSIASPSDVLFHVKVTLVFSTLRQAAALGVSSGIGSAATQEATQSVNAAAANRRRTVLSSNGCFPRPALPGGRLIRFMLPTFSATGTAKRFPHGGQRGWSGGAFLIK